MADKAAAEQKRALKKQGKADVARRSAELQAASSAANPARIGSDEWAVNYQLATARERWLQRKRPLLRATQLQAMFVVLPHDGSGWSHPGAYVFCTVCGSAIPCAVPNRLLYWRSCGCGNAGWRAMFGWTTWIARRPEVLVPVKLIGRGGAAPTAGPAVEVRIPAPQRFSIRQRPRERTPGANYEYDILDGSDVIAGYWHDFRGDEHGIVFADGRSEDRPVGRPADFIMNGGPFALRLSSAAVAYLTRLRESK
jgi:hypothetical protein